MRHLLAVGLVVVGMVAIIAASAFVGVSLGTSAADSDSVGAGRFGHPIAAGATRFQSSDGYSFLLPAGWSASEIDAVRNELLMNALHASDSTTAMLVDRVLAITHGRISVVGGDMQVLSNVSSPPNVTVLQDPETTTLAKAVAQITAALGAAREASGIRVSSATVSGRHATRITWTLARPPSGATSATPSSAPPSAVLSTYIFQGDKGVLVLTVGRGASATNWQASLEDSIVKSFTLEKLADD
jgi:hypothetical protein